MSPLADILHRPTAEDPAAEPDAPPDIDAQVAKVLARVGLIPDDLEPAVLASVRADVTRRHQPSPWDRAYRDGLDEQRRLEAESAARAECYGADPERLVFVGEVTLTDPNGRKTRESLRYADADHLARMYEREGDRYFPLFSTEPPSTATPEWIITAADRARLTRALVSTDSP